jgi:hypothetical protein
MTIADTFDWHDVATPRIAPRESSGHCLDRHHSTAPWRDAHRGLAAYTAYDEGYLTEAPWALEAYLAHHQLGEDQ